jgi:large subunit ribosomal protein L30
MLKITLTSGLVAKTDKQRKIVRALGLRKFSSSVEHADSPTIRGMLNRVSHLVKVEAIEGKGDKAKPKAAEKKTTKKVATEAGAAKAAK